MADQQQAEQAEKETPAEATPTSEQKTSEPKAEEASPQGDSASQAKADEPSLPEGVKERTTQQFDKLKQELKAERERARRYEQMFGRQLSPQPPKQPDQQPDTDWYDPETNMVDVNKLKQYNQRLETQLGQLNQRVQSFTQMEQRQQEQETYQAYPELNPESDGFDTAFSDAVQGALTSAFLRGERPTFKEAADKIASFAGKKAKAAEKEGANRAMEQLTQKEQAALEATGRSDKRADVREDVQQLAQRTRKGDIDAIMKRMKGAS
jgi:hypothetical protein